VEHRAGKLEGYRFGVLPFFTLRKPTVRRAFPESQKAISFKKDLVVLYEKLLELF